MMIHAKHMDELRAEYTTLRIKLRNALRVIKLAEQEIAAGNDVARWQEQLKITDDFAGRIMHRLTMICTSYPNVDFEVRK